MTQQLTYAWKEGSRYSADPQLVGQEIQRIARAKGRAFEAITPEDLIESAKEPESPLHGLFEWDLEKAAVAHWMQQARQVLRSIRPVIVMDGTPKAVLGYVSVKVDGAPVYVTTSHAARNAELREQMLAAGISGLESWRRRYQDLQDLAEVFTHVDSAIDVLSRARKGRAAANQARAHAQAAG